MQTFYVILLGFHALLGTVAVIAGALALGVRKGAAWHIGSGRGFAVTMALASGVGAVLGLLKFETYFITFHAGILGVTLVLSGWSLARKQHTHPRFRLFALLNGANAVALVALGFYGLGLAEQKVLGFAAADYLFLAAISGVAAVCDGNVWLRKTISTRHRIADHLWRMCVGFFIAAGSAFTGPGAQAFPEVVQDSGVLALPELVIFLLMLFWLVRTLWIRRHVSAHAG